MSFTLTSLRTFQVDARDPAPAGQLSSCKSHAPLNTGCLGYFAASFGGQEGGKFHCPISSHHGINMGSLSPSLLLDASTLTGDGLPKDWAKFPENSRALIVEIGDI